MNTCRLKENACETGRIEANRSECGHCGRFPFDEALLEFATSANVCCGEHAGSPELSLQTAERCRARGIRVGAHPGYPDRASMGRLAISTDTQRVYLDSVFSQMKRFVASAQPDYVKPHGAFYNDTAVSLKYGWDHDETGKPAYQAGGIFLAAYPGVQSLSMLLRLHRLPLMGLDRTAHRAVADRNGQTLIREGFADRAYRPDGALMDRSEFGAVLTDPTQIRRQVLQLAPRVDSLCLHGDTPNCVTYAELVRKTLTDAGYEVKPYGV